MRLAPHAVGHVARLHRARVPRLRQLRRSGPHRTGYRNGQANEASARVSGVRAVLVRWWKRIIREPQRAPPEELTPARERHAGSGRIATPGAPVGRSAVATAATAAAAGHGHVPLRGAAPSKVHAHGVPRTTGRCRRQPRGRPRRGHEQDVGAPAAEPAAATHGPSHSEPWADRWPGVEAWAQLAG